MKTIFQKIKIGLFFIGAIFAFLFLKKSWEKSSFNLKQLKESAEKEREKKRDEIQNSDSHDLVESADNADVLRERIDEIKSDNTSRIKDRIKSDIQRN